MFGFGWMTLRQVQEALQAGSLDEAQRLLDQPSLRGHRKHTALVRQLARAYVERGEQHLRQDEIDPAWDALLKAERTETGERTVQRLRHNLTRLGLAQVRALLQAGEPRRASEVIGQLRDRFVRHAELQMLEDTTKNWLTAQELAEQGDFAQALQSIDRLRHLLLGPPGPLEHFRQSLLDKQRDFGERLARLHDAADGARWREVLEIAEGVLAVAPQHPEAKKARARAWRAIEPVTVAMRSPAEPASPVSPREEGPPQRFFLWVDGVGGYLVCLSPNITLGQAALDAPVDVPLLADVSRLHAVIARDSDGGYLLEASRPVQVNGEPATRAVLQPGDRLTLGGSCQLRFQRPVPVSTSARLDLVSGHRSLPGVDSILLMADTVVLGPGEQSHVRMHDLKQPLVLYRSKEGLGVRCPGHFLVDGKREKDRAALGETALVSGDDFSLALEPA